MLSNEVVERLERAIAEAEHKPGAWHVSALTFGAAAIREDAPGQPIPFNETVIGNFPWKRDGWLAVAAVNALPELLRVYRAWLDAPQAVASDAEVIALAGGNHWHAKIALLGPAAKELGGQRVRLVRDGDSGEG